MKVIAPPYMWYCQKLSNKNALTTFVSIYNGGKMEDKIEFEELYKAYELCLVFS